MMKTLLVLAVVACAVMADNYWCPQVGEAFQCFESAPDRRFCLSNGKDTTVICSKCRKKFEFCKRGMQTSKRADYDCGAGWDSTPCTPDITDVPSIF